MKIVGATGLGGLWALAWEWQTFFDQSIGNGKTNTYQLQFLWVWQSF